METEWRRVARVCVDDVIDQSWATQAQACRVHTYHCSTEPEPISQSQVILLFVLVLDSTQRRSFHLRAIDNSQIVRTKREPVNSYAYLCTRCVSQAGLEESR